MRTKRLLLGMVAGNAVGLFFCALVYGLVLMGPNSLYTSFIKTIEAITGLKLLSGIWVASLPSLFLVPFCIGVAASWIWKPLDLKVGAVLLHSLTCTAISILIAVLVFREGAICVIIVSPVLYGGIAAGALAGRVWFRKDRGRLNVFLAPILALAVIIEPTARAPHTSVVTDEIRIAAPPSKVWPHVLAFESIPEHPRFWLFRFGLPYPTETTNGGNFVGADRACRFSGGAVFKEKVADLDPGHLLTFDIVQMPPDPELLGHLDAHRGQFELRDNDDGTTTLIGRTWYSLHVRPAWYFDWWTHTVFRAVHLRVMRNIQRLAEQQP